MAGFAVNGAFELEAGGVRIGLCREADATTLATAAAIDDGKDDDEDGDDDDEDGESDRDDDISAACVVDASGGDSGGELNDRDADSADAKRAESFSA